MLTNVSNTSLDVTTDNVKGTGYGCNKGSAQYVGLAVAGASLLAATMLWSQGSITGRRLCQYCHDDFGGHCMTEDAWESQLETFMTNDSYQWTNFGSGAKVSTVFVESMAEEFRAEEKVIAWVNEEGTNRTFEDAMNPRTVEEIFAEEIFGGDKSELSYEEQVRNPVKKSKYLAFDRVADADNENGLGFTAASYKKHNLSTDEAMQLVKAADRWCCGGYQAGTGKHEAVNDLSNGLYYQGRDATIFKPRGNEMKWFDTQDLKGIQKIVHMNWNFNHEHFPDVPSYDEQQQQVVEDWLVSDNGFGPASDIAKLKAKAALEG